LKRNKHCGDKVTSRSDRQPRQRQQRDEDKIDALIRDDRSITSDLCVAAGIGKLAVMAITRGLVTEKAARGG